MTVRGRDLAELLAPGLLAPALDHDGAARVVQCAPKVALALGYDVESALERVDE